MKKKTFFKKYVSLLLSFILIFAFTANTIAADENFEIVAYVLELEEGFVQFTKADLIMEYGVYADALINGDEAAAAVASPFYAAYVNAIGTQDPVLVIAQPSGDWLYVDFTAFTTVLIESIKSPNSDVAAAVAAARQVQTVADVLVGETILIATITEDGKFEASEEGSFTIDETGLITPAYVDDLNTLVNAVAGKVTSESAITVTGDLTVDNAKAAVKTHFESALAEAAKSEDTAFKGENVTFTVTVDNIVASGSAITSGSAIDVGLTVKAAIGTLGLESYSVTFEKLVLFFKQ